MKIVDPLIFKSKSELYENLDAVLEKFKSDAIVGIRGLRLSESEQLQLVRDLGDIIGWFPNNSEKFNHKYIENHSSNWLVPDSTGDQVILGWHLEHVDYDDYIPIVAGVWNMQNFKGSSDNGKTYFMDARKVYELVTPEEDREFLKKSRAMWNEEYEKDVYTTCYVDAIQNHWLSKEPQIRLELTHIDEAELYEFDGNTPTEEEKAKFREVALKFNDQVYNNEDLRIVHRWEEGDILIPDLFALAHAVTGGFKSEEREFTGFWCYSSSPTSAPEEKVFPRWN
jgi:alpha-ketoglutarate-dependent taurine dioxygenase